MMCAQDDGATAVEYSIMAALIAAVIVLVVVALGGQTCEMYEDTSAAMESGGIGVADTC